jgi:hypothetical protein
MITEDMHPSRLLPALAFVLLAPCAAGANPDCRSQETGRLLARGPGFLVHGLGEWYAGNMRMATSLAGGEMLALGLGYYSGGFSHFGRDSKPMAVFAVGIFLATWVIDVLKAPDEINRWNRAHGCGGPSPIEVGSAGPLPGAISMELH